MFIRTERLFLRPCWPEDWQELFGLIDEGLIRDLASAPWPYPKDDAQAFISSAHERRLPRFAVTLPTADSAVLLSVSGLAANTNYLMEVIVLGATSTWNTLRAEVLDPLDSDDWMDMAPYHDGVPAGYSTSHTRDGFSFAQSTGLERSAEWVGGSATVKPDEETNRADVLIFTGVAGASSALRVTFGLRDYDGNRNFLVRLSAEDGVSATPEPASMLLIGTGLAGLAAMRRRRGAPVREPAREPARRAASRRPRPPGGSAAADGRCRHAPPAARRALRPRRPPCRPAGRAARCCRSPSASAAG